MKKSELVIKEEQLDEERKNLEEIFQCINDNKSWCFDAGAGAGKTYSLVETLKYILKKKFNSLQTNNQKILCISYTNVAANEIKKKLGNSDLVEVSTIHNCLWSAISKHQEALIIIHKEKLLEEIKNKNDELEKEVWAEKYRNLPEENKKLFKELLIEKKEIYYKSKSKNAAIFKKNIIEISQNFSDLLSNVTNFKKIADRILKNIDFENAIINIEIKKITSVEYDYRYNYDRLDKMKISHDTLLEYSNKLLKNNDILKQFFCDKYPIILVDEYQDTNPLVIELLKYIEDFSKKINRQFILGFFGDKKQNIYENGVGEKFNEYFNQIIRIKKEFNRRSSNQIIEVSNIIRNDDLKQKSIYSNFDDNKVLFFNILESESDKIVDYFSDKLQICENNKLHCFELTNEKVAEKNGFSNIYSFFKETSYYKKNYQSLVDQTLSTDTTKLGRVQMIIYKLLDFLNIIKNPKKSLTNIINKKLFNENNLKQIQIFFDLLKDIEENTVYSVIDSMFCKYKKGNELFDKCVSYIFSNEIKCKDDFTQYIFDNLFEYDELEENNVENKKNIEVFLNLEISYFQKWYMFINNIISQNVVYHTYHSTKGAEFENVIVFLNADFGRKRDYFKNLILHLDSDTKETDIISARNLFYVSLTRAINNLIVIYTSDINEIMKNNIEKAFGKIMTIKDI